MNRVKLWVFALAVAAAAAVGLRAHALRLRAQAIAALDARLAAASAHVSGTSRALAREAAVAAAFVSRDARLVEALHQKEEPPPPVRTRRGKAPPPRRPSRVDEEAQEAALREAARAALAEAEKAFGFELPPGTVVTAGNREWLARKGPAGGTEGEAMGLLRGAIGGKTGRGYVRLNGALLHAAAAPAEPGAGLVVLVPVDEAWAKGVAAAAGADLTVVAPEVKPFSTVRGADAQAIASAVKAPGAAQDVGRVAKVELPLGPVPVPALPIPLGDLPGHRARAVPFEGVKGGLAIVSVPAAAALRDVAAFEWYAAAGLAAFLLVALVLGFFVRSHEAPAVVPEALLAAATRIEQGDFSARAPVLAGTLGTVATALNRAAELAGPAAAAETAGAAGGGPFGRDAPSALLGDGPVEARLPPPRPPPSPVTRTATAFPAASPPAAPEAEPDEEAQWQQVFQDFLRTRAGCGESTDGLTFEKFRIKLEGNKAALAAKHGCRTVRFQVYVKDGKAALKATPVR